MRSTRSLEDAVKLALFHLRRGDHVDRLDGPRCTDYMIDDLERALASAKNVGDYVAVPVECTPAMECYGEDEAYRLGLRGVEKGMIASIWRAMAKAAPMPKLPPVWMPVTSDAPMPGVPVLAWSDGQDAYIGKRHNEHTWTSPDCDYSFTGVSHWMPIPTPPSCGGN